MIEDAREEETLEAALDLSPPDPRAWLEPIYRRHATSALRTAYRLTGNLADAEDVLHTVFIRLARRERPLEPPGAAPAYLRRAVTNAALDLARSRRVQTSTSLDDVLPAATVDPSPTPDRQHLGRELGDRLRRALAELSPRHAEMFVLRYLEGLDNRQIADELRTTAGTVAVTLHRVRARLCVELAPYLGGRP